MNILEHLVYRLQSRVHDYKMIEHSQHLFDSGKRAALLDEIRWLEKLIRDLQH